MGWMPMADGSVPNPGLSKSDLDGSDRQWIPVSIGLPRDDVEVETKNDRGEILIGFLYKQDFWFTSDRHAMSGTPTHWRPKLAPPASRQVGCTAAGEPITLCTCGQSPSYYLLEMEIDGRRSKWVDMATVIRMRNTIGAMLTAYRGDVPILSEEFEKLIQACEGVWRSSPAE